MPKHDKVEQERRIRLVVEWLIDEWPYMDIVNTIMSKWNVSDRMAKYYIQKARLTFGEEEEAKLDIKRRQRIAALKKELRSLKKEYIGTPEGIRARASIHKLIISLEGTAAPKQMRFAGAEGEPPIEQKVTKETDLSQLPIVFE